MKLYQKLIFLDKKQENLLKMIEKYYLIIMVIISLLIIWLNYYANTMLGIYPYYLDFKNIILSGFELSIAKLFNPTFPMWGYGWLLCLSESKIVLLLIQFFLAIFSIWYLLKEVQKYNMLNKKIILTFKIVLIFAIPFYAFHSVRWPYSISISLITLSLILFVVSNFYQNNYYKNILSGILFGLALNFRSDYFILPLVFIPCIIIFFKTKVLSIKRLLTWIIPLYSLLIPWGLYTMHVCGHFLFTSTNAGHVFFIGLGNLPDNKWHITPIDEDSVLQQTIYNFYGKNKSTLLYGTDKYLKKTFINLVKNDPKEYFRKNFYSFKSMLISGVYPGEFNYSEAIETGWVLRGETWHYVKNAIGQKKNYYGLRKKIFNDPLNIFSYIPFIHIIKTVLTRFSTWYGKITIFISFLFLPFGIYYSIIKKNYLVFSAIILILFQSIINVFAYQWYLYTSNVFLFHLLNLCFSIYYFIYIFKKNKISKTSITY